MPDAKAQKVGRHPIAVPLRTKWSLFLRGLVLSIRRIISLKKGGTAMVFWSREEHRSHVQKQAVKNAENNLFSNRM